MLRSTGIAAAATSGRLPSGLQCACSARDQALRYIWASVSSGASATCFAAVNRAWKRRKRAVKTAARSARARITAEGTSIELNLVVGLVEKFMGSHLVVNWLSGEESVRRTATDVSQMIAIGMLINA